MCCGEESNLLCQPLAPALFLRIALNWGKQPVVNLPSDRLLRRGVQVRREYRLIGRALFSFGEVILGAVTQPALPAGLPVCCQVSILHSSPPVLLGSRGFVLI